MRLLSASVDGEVGGTVRAPPSKSYTHRAVFMASLSDGTSTIRDPLLAQDTLATIEGCSAFGATIRRGRGMLEVKGVPLPLTPRDVVDVRNSGTTLRILTSLLGCTRSGFSILTGDDSIKRRPMQPLLSALSGLGVDAWSALGNGCAPVIVKGGGMRGGTAEIEGSVSSQFVSSLLISSPLSREGVRISVRNPVSRPYIDTTIFLLQKFGVSVDREGYTSFRVEPQTYREAEVRIPGDFSSSSFLFAACALAGGSVRVGNLDPTQPQADSMILGIMQRLGIDVQLEQNTVAVKCDSERLAGCEVDLRDCPDLLPVLAVLGLKAESPVAIRGVGHARFKESDRIGTIVSELSKIGAELEETPDGVIIKPLKRVKKAVLDPHGDHRLFMAFFLASLLGKGIYVLGGDLASVSYPGFLRDMRRIGVMCEVRVV